MRKNIKGGAIFPMPVLMVATYSADGKVDVMNAAWGTMYETDKVAICLSSIHKTVQNIKEKKAFTVSFADEKHIKEADYFGMVSANKEPDKFSKSGLTAIKSEFVDAPVIDEFPICLECEYLGRDEKTGFVYGKVKNISADESVLEDGKVNIELIKAIVFDSFSLGYYRVAGRVGNAFKDGLKL